jgi:hypothetical protein
MIYSSSPGPKCRDVDGYFRDAICVKDNPLRKGPADTFRQIAIDHLHGLRLDEAHR